MNMILAAARGIAHDIGNAALAKLLNMSPNILRNKISESNTTHHLTLLEASRITALTGDPRILYAFANEHGYICVRLPMSASINEQSFMEHMFDIGEANGDLNKAVRDALTDGVVTRKESKTVCDVIRLYQERLAQLSQAIESVSQDEA